VSLLSYLQVIAFFGTLGSTYLSGAWPLLLSGWTIAQRNLTTYISMHYFIYYIEKLKLC
jgi:hypothetical protein